MKIYLAGSVPKGDEEAKSFDDWRQRYKLTLKKILPDATFINPLEHKAGEEIEKIRGEILSKKTKNLSAVIDEAIKYVS